MNPEANDTVPQSAHLPTSGPDIDLVAVCEGMRACGPWALLLGILMLLGDLGVGAAMFPDLARNLFPLDRASFGSNVAFTLVVSAPYLVYALGVLLAALLAMRFGLAARRVGRSPEGIRRSLAVAVRRQHHFWKWGVLSLILGVIGMAALTPLVWGALMLYGIAGDR